MILAAALAAINVPFGKYLTGQMPIMLLSSLTCLGGAFGVGIVFLISRLTKKNKEPLLKGKDWISVLIINLFDCAANVMLFYGINLLNGETASLLQTFELVATALFANLFFKEKISWRLWTAIGIILCASFMLTFDPTEGFTFNNGAILVIGATIMWGIEDNLAKHISHKDPIEVTFFKCLTPGVVILIIALSTHQITDNYSAISLALFDGCVAYGMSITLMIWCFRHMSAPLGIALYSSNPFFGVIYSIAIFREFPKWNFYVSLALLIIGEAIVIWDGFITYKNTAKPQELEKEN